MHHPHTKHTIDIFARINDRLPPLLPEEIKKEFGHALEHMQSDVTITSVDVEEMVIGMGKKIWPYWKAFGEFLDLYQGKFGEKFLLARLSLALKSKFKDFKEHGGTYQDLRSGHPSDFFGSSEEILEIKQALVEVDGDVHLQAEQAVLSTERIQYEEMVVEFQNILDSIEDRLQTLRTMAEDEEEHPRLAEEIREQIKTFEFGLCLLGPNTRYDHVDHAEDYFVERKISKKLHRLA